jgi:hypothetical protein
VAVRFIDGGPEENHRPVTSHWQTLSHCCIVYISPWSRFEVTTSVVIGTDCILNTTYIVLMKNVRDVSQVATLGRQLFLGYSKVSTVCYTDALSVGPYSYLIVDASPHSEDKYRLRTNVFPGPVHLSWCLFKMLIIHCHFFNRPAWLYVPYHKFRPYFKLYGSVS